MKTTIYWTAIHGRRAVDELRFRATCWRLRQQVEFLEWRLSLKGLMPHPQSKYAPIPEGQGSQYAVHSM